MVSKASSYLSVLAGCTVPFPLCEKVIPIKLEDLKEKIAKNQEILKTVDSISFNIFNCEKAFGKSFLLPVLSYYILDKNNAFTKIEEKAFCLFIANIQSGYSQPNSYHNYLHATDVLQLVHYMINYCNLKTVLKLDLINIIGLLIGAIIHDFKHPGFSSGILENSLHKLAIRYNNQSILENFHLAQAFKVILKEKGCNIFINFTKEEFVAIRKQLVLSILATDMVKHHQSISALKASYTNENEKKQAIINAVLHAADIGTSTRQIPVFEEWTTRVYNEFFSQGDLEKKLKLPVSFNCDRDKVNIIAGQSDYIKTFVKPLYEALEEVIQDFKQLKENVANLEKEWNKKLH